MIFEKPEPDSESQGSLRTDDGVVGPVWSIGPILPPSLIKLLDICDTENNNDENNCTDDEPNLEEDVEINYDDMLTEDDYLPDFAYFLIETYDLLVSIILRYFTEELLTL